MNTPETMVEALRRPDILVRAARHGVDHYRRATALPRLLGPGPVPGPRAAILRLLEREAAMEAARRGDGLGYEPASHVALVTALLGELRAARAAGQAKASGSAALRDAT
ncbi:MAG: DUF6477 family protein [Paracoccaceae bacterium]